MKNILVSVLLLSFSSAAFAASNKVCFGSTKDPDTKGVIMLAKLSPKAIVLKTIKGLDFDYNGTFHVYPNTVVKGRDGKTYLQYDGRRGDYQEVILVNKDLLKTGTMGLLQIRARGEGFFNSVFVCKDSN
jgi:hypothetical protein